NLVIRIAAERLGPFVHFHIGNTGIPLVVVTAVLTFRAGLHDSESHVASPAIDSTRSHEMRGATASRARICKPHGPAELYFADLSTGCIINGGKSRQPCAGNYRARE